MNIQHKDNGKSGSFYVIENDKIVGEMTYEHSRNNIIIIDHTEVDNTLRRKGLGNQLVREGVDYARKNNLKIVPVCPFAKAVIERTPEYKDVLVT